MSRILFAWELGEGYGHLAPFRPVAEALAARGHEVMLAARDVQNAMAVYERTAVRVMQAPLCQNVYGGLESPALNYAEILMRFGYRDPPQLRGLLRAWRDLIVATGAELVIADHAPSALLAARGLRTARAVFGLPFCVPPPSDPTPSMHPWLNVPAQRLVSSDAAVLDTINACLTGSKLAALHRIFENACPLFLGTPELDPYGPREPRHYVGLLADTAGGCPPAWPPHDGPRAIAYLKSSFRHIEAALDALAASRACCVVHLSGNRAPALARQYQRPSLVFSDLLDMDRGVTECDFVVCHAGLGTVIAALRGGKPLLLLPEHLDQVLLARRAEQLGAARTVALAGAQPDFQGALEAVIQGGTLPSAAADFAARHGAVPVGTIVADVVHRIEAMRAVEPAERPA